MQYMTLYFYCTVNLGEFFLSPHLLLDHVSINPPNILFYQSGFQLVYALDIFTYPDAKYDRLEAENRAS